MRDFHECECGKLFAWHGGVQMCRESNHGRKKEIDPMAEQAHSSVSSSEGVYGAVQWINDKPVLDGMPYFETKEACIEYANRMGARDTPPGISVRYTIIRLERAI